MSVTAALRKPRLRIGAVLAVALAAGVAAWLVLRAGGDSTDAAGQSSGATAMTTAELGKLATSIRHPVYWLGPKPGFTYEATLTRDGKIYVRYLPGDAGVGAGKPYLPPGTPRRSLELVASHDFVTGVTYRAYRRRS